MQCFNSEKLMQCFNSEKQSNQITHYDETKKMANDSQIARATENQVELRLAQPRTRIRHQLTD